MNYLFGLGGDDVLDGGAGADAMIGGLGNDLYVVDTAGDQILEASGEGSDTVHVGFTYALGANVENLTLTGTSAINGTGNGLNNRITGNGAANLLDGGIGADSMRGGAGNDTYVLDNGGDVVIEYAGEGIDTVRSLLDYRLGSDVEKLVLIGTAVIGTGNSLDNTILGNASNNFINGAEGADSMRGSAGNDTYVLDNGGDVVVKYAGEGIDTVRSYLDHRLGSNVKKLVLIGSGAINGTGNSLANTITGNEAANVISGGNGDDSLRGMGGNDTLIGGVGNDSLVGGSGADMFVFDARLNSLSNVDRLTDFSVVDDTLVLKQTVFTGLATGALSAEAFRTGTAAQDADDRIIYDQASGRLYYDADGNGAGAAVLFAQLNAGTALSNADFLIGG